MDKKNRHDPNLQNIPIRTPEGKSIRDAFALRDDYWYPPSADYTQIELRILEHLMKEQN